MSVLVAITVYLVGEAGQLGQSTSTYQYNCISGGEGEKGRRGRDQFLLGVNRMRGKGKLYPTI
jgi:hypothetical protein